MLVCILNYIPLFVVGKPGASKSLSANILAASMRGAASASEFLRRFPAIELMRHQVWAIRGAPPCVHKARITAGIYNLENKLSYPHNFL